MGRLGGVRATTRGEAAGSVSLSMRGSSGVEPTVGWMAVGWATVGAMAVGGVTVGWAGVGGAKVG
jgi:hypothetical protein